MQGWSPDFIPKLTGDAVDMKVIDQIIRIPGPDALKCSRELAQKEGIFVGITSGATFAGALQAVRRGAEGLDRPVHAARHRRALSQHAALRRHRAGHERGGDGDLPLDAGVPVPGGVIFNTSSLFPPPPGLTRGPTKRRKEFVGGRVKPGQGE